MVESSSAIEKVSTGTRDGIKEELFTLARNYIKDMETKTKLTVDDKKKLYSYYVDGEEIDGEKLRVAMTKYHDSRINLK